MTKRLRAERATVEAKRFLSQHGIRYDEPNQGHLKIGRSINYWPTSGKMFIDATSGSRVDRGVSALEAVLREQGYLRGPAAPKATPRTPKPITPALSGQADLQMPTAEAFTPGPALAVELSDTPKDHDHD
ncbi:MAG: hypothetical protein ACJ8AW_37900 [Rhodopila sp.]